MKPTIIEHPTFGRLLWDERMTSYEGEADLGPDGKIRLSLQPFTDVVPGQEPGELGDPTAFVDLCAGKLGWVREHVQMLSSYVASQLLADHNDGDWCAGEPITESEFVRRITLTDVTIDQDGTIEVCFDDGDLFWGHALLARVNPEGEPEHAEFFG